MAIDKAVDSTVLDAGLKAIADAIREKAGTSDNLAFPDAMAAAIAAIESGGGLSFDGFEMISGSFVCSETPTSKVAIKHDVTTSGDYAIFVFCFNDTGSGLNMACCEGGSGGFRQAMHYNSTSSKGYGSIFSDVYSNSFYLASDAYPKIVAGINYYWVRIYKE